MSLMKLKWGANATVRALAATGVALSAATSVWVPVCAHAAGSSNPAGPCPKPSWIPFSITAVLLAGLIFLLLSRRGEILRRPIAAALLGIYSAFASVAAFEEAVAWHFLLPMACVIAAVGILLRRPWGAWVMIAVSLALLCVLGFGFLDLTRVGVFRFTDTLTAFLILIPGPLTLFFALGFCCYVARVPTGAPPRV